jgi:hypothetical protein
MRQSGHHFESYAAFGNVAAGAAIAGEYAFLVVRLA